MLRRLQIAILLASVFLLGSDVQTLACELSCAAEAHQDESAQTFSHHHPSTSSQSADMQSEALQVVVSGEFGFVTDQRALPNCAPADPVTFNVLVTTESNTLSHSGAALVENNVTLDLLERQSPSVFESPPHAPSVSQRNLTPLRI